MSGEDASAVTLETENERTADDSAEVSLVDRLRHAVALVLAGVLLIGTILAVGAVGAMFLARPNQVYHHFDTHAEAVAAGLLRDGWIPQYLPETMRDVHASYDLDTSQSVVRFSLSEEEMREFAQDGPGRLGFKPIDPLDDDYLKRAETWIPDDGAIPDLDSGEFEFYGGRTLMVAGPSHLAVDVESRTIYHWVR